MSDLTPKQLADRLRMVMHQAAQMMSDLSEMGYVVNVSFEYNKLTSNGVSRKLYKPQVRVFKTEEL